MSVLAALAAAVIAPPEEVAPPPSFEPALRAACAGAWRAVEVVLAGDVLRGRLGKTRDTIVREAVDGVLALHGNVGIRADALASLRAARDAGELDGAVELATVIGELRAHGAGAAGRAAVAAIRKHLASYRDLEQALADAELASLLIDTARAIFRFLGGRDPELARWAIGPTGSPGRDRALAAFAELATSPESLAELEALIAIPIALDDNVQFTVYRPRAIDPGRWHQLLAFAHLAERRPGEDDLPDPIEEVQRQAAAVLGDKANRYSPVVQDAGAAIPAEGELTFVPELPGIEVNPPRRSFTWLETVHREEFRIRAGRELDGKTVRGRVTVFLGSIAIAEVACAIKIDAARPEPKREPTSVRAYRKIFASYSHRDLEIVNQFESYARALGDEYLRDWVHLRTGEVWTDRLCQLIAQADAFQLFWSRNSMHSQFVRQEYEYALSLNRPSFVRPTYWEDPMPTAPGLPPEALLRLHFQKLGAGLVATEARDQPELARERRSTRKQELVVEREREDAYGADAHDVTDPDYEPPALQADASASMLAPPPAPSVDSSDTVEMAQHAIGDVTKPGIGALREVSPAQAPRPAPAPARPAASPPAPSLAAQPAQPAPPAPPAQPSAAAPPPPMAQPARPTPSPITITSPGVAPAPSRPSSAGAAKHAAAPPAPPPEPGPVAKSMMGVSPFAPTVPQQAYQPQPGDPILATSTPDASAASAPELEEPSPAAMWRPELPAQRSWWPLALIGLGVIALLAVVVIWILR